MRRGALSLVLATLLSCSAAPAQTTRPATAADNEVRRAADIELPDGFAYPNGITRGSDGTLFVGSVTSGTILRIAPDGGATVLLEGDTSHFAGTALEYDESTGLLWISSPDFLGTEVDGHRVFRPHRIAVVDPAKRVVVWSVEVPTGGFVNDIALDGKGGAFLTDSTLGCVWHLAEPGADFDRFAESPLLRGEGIGPAGIARDSDGTMFVGLYDDGRLLRVSAQGGVTALPTTTPLRNPDGLELTDDGRLLVVEGAIDDGRGRLVAIDLHSPAPHQVQVLAEGLDTPVNLVRVGSQVVVTESRLRHRMRPQLGLPAPQSWTLRRVSLQAPQRTTVAVATLPSAFFPESIARDHAGQFYVGSANRSEIVRVSAGGDAEVWISAQAGGLMSVQGLLVSGDQLFACTADLGKHATPTEPSALVGFDLQTAQERGRWTLPDEGFCNDIAHVPGGDFLITDTMGARLWRVDPRQDGPPAVWIADDRLAGANGIATSSDGETVFVSTFADGRLLQVSITDPPSVALVPLPRALDGGDALRITAGGELLAFENGLSRGRGALTLISLGKDGAKLSAVVETSVAPTSGVIVGDEVVWPASNFGALFGGDETAMYDRSLYRTALP